VVIRYHTATESASGFRLRSAQTGGGGLAGARPIRLLLTLLGAPERGLPRNLIGSERPRLAGSSPAAFGIDAAEADVLLTRLEIAI